MKKTGVIRVTGLLVFLSLSSLVLTSDLIPLYQVVSGTISGGSIFYQDNDFITINNPFNPINVEIISMTNASNLNFCYNYLQEEFPVSGAGTNMPNCPEGGFAVLTANSSSTAEPLQKLSRKYSARSNLLRSILDIQDTTQTASQINVPPSKLGGIVVAPTSNSVSSDFTIKITYYSCEEQYYPIGVNNSCAKLTGVVSTLPNEIPTPVVPANSWIYYSFSTNSYSSTSNNYITVSVNSSLAVYLQQDYIPTSTWYLASATNGDPIEIYTPGTFTQSQTYYVGIFNSGTTDVSNLLLNISLSSCNSTFFGYQCQVQTSGSAADPLNQITPISANLTLVPSQQTSTTNNGTTLSFDYDDDDAYSGQYLYFSITQPPSSGALRIGVAANDHEDNAPDFYAKLGGYPSSLSYHYAVKGESVSSQMVIPVDSNDNWYIAVQLPSDFSIWVGTNCANNCSQQLHGTCYCSAADGTLTNCMTLTNNGSNPSAFYIFPTNIGDSSGLCECEDDLFGGFECTDVLSYTPVILILVVTLVTAVILVIVIALPSYFYLKHKKKMLYEQL